MSTITKLTTCEDVALITLRNSPADMRFIAKVFKTISQRGINVDMISQTAPQGSRISLSFTVPGNEMGSVLELLAILREDNPELKSDISIGNCKISIYGEAMREEPGVAAAVFEIVAGLSLDVRLITTSEIDISLLVPKSDFEAAYEAFKNAYKL
jgi:aspartokinase